MADTKRMMELLRKYRSEMGQPDPILANAAKDKYEYMYERIKAQVAADKAPPQSAGEADAMDSHQRMLDRDEAERAEILSGKYSPKMMEAIPDINDYAKMYDYTSMRDALDPPVGPQLPPRGLDTSGAADFSLHPESNKGDADTRDLHEQLLAKVRKEREDTLAGRNLPQAAPKEEFLPARQMPLQINPESYSVDPSAVGGVSMSEAEKQAILKAIVNAQTSSADYQPPNPVLQKLLGGK